jgi:2'-5' RNA ligase
MAESAFIVRVPEAEPQVAHLRERFDPMALLGVPAHITLLYPFLSPEQITTPVLGASRTIASAMTAFPFRLDRIGRFPGVLYLAPEPATPFAAFTNALARRFPEFPPYGGQFQTIVPHLTVAHVNDAECVAIEGELRSSLLSSGGVSASCREISLIENSSGRWKLMHVLPLSSAARSHGT